MNDLKEFYDRVSDARESCAGCSIQPLDVVRSKVRGCIYFGNAKRIDKKYLTQLTEALSLLNEVKTYEQRLKPDEILCGILNDILHKQRGEQSGGDKR